MVEIIEFYPNQGRHWYNHFNWTDWSGWECLESNNTSNKALTVISKSNLSLCDIGLARTGNAGILRMQFGMSDASKIAQAKCILPNGLAGYSQGSVPVTVYGSNGSNLMILAFWASGTTLQIDIYPMLGSATGVSSAENFINVPLVFS